MWAAVSAVRDQMFVYDVPLGCENTRVKAKIPTTNLSAALQAEREVVSSDDVTGERST